MANISACMSSKDMTWETPQDLFDELDREFGFTLDVAAQLETAKTTAFFSPEDNGLSKDWLSYQAITGRVEGKRGACWMNPPYGREIGKWIAKAAKEARRGALVVALIPSRTDTAYFHDHIWDLDNNRPRPWVREVRFLRGRLKFGQAKNSAPFPSMIVVFSMQYDHTFRGAE